MKKRKRRKRRKNNKFIKLVIILIFLILGLATMTNILKGNTIKVMADSLYENGKEDVVIEETEKIEENNIVNLGVEKLSLDNSEYLRLEDDPNADDASIVLPQTMYKYNFYRDDNKKIAYLTFDDGPSENVTDKILDVLKRNDIKATFFTVGNEIDKNPNSKKVLKRMAKEGHSIANHGYSHQYRILYPNGTVDTKAFIGDMKKNEDLLKSILGKDFTTRVLRMPGGHGSWNGVKALDEVLVANNMYQMDWNSLNGDAEGHGLQPEYLLKRLKETIKDQDVAIVLMHDTEAKENTVQFLQSGIDYLKSKGYEFRTLK